MDDEQIDRDFELSEKRSYVLDTSWTLVQALNELKQEEPELGRLWAIAATDAEKLHAWIGYVLPIALDEG